MIQVVLYSDTLLSADKAESKWLNNVRLNDSKS